MRTITINRHGQGYIGKELAQSINAERLKVVPLSHRTFVIMYSHSKLNKVYHNERGCYVYCTKRLIPGKYIVSNEFEGYHNIK